MAIDRGGSISGLVLDGTVPTPYAPVHLYYRISGMLIIKTLCNTLGEYKFRGLDRYSSDYFAVAMFDGDNAQIYDHLTPS